MYPDPDVTKEAMNDSRLYNDIVEHWSIFIAVH